METVVAFVEVGSWKLEVGSWKLEVGSWKLEVGSWKLEVGSWKLEVVSWKLEVGSWKLEVGSWKLEVGSWKLEVGSWKLEVGSWIVLCDRAGIEANGASVCELTDSGSGGRSNCSERKSTIRYLFARIGGRHELTILVVWNLQLGTGNWHWRLVARGWFCRRFVRIENPVRVDLSRAGYTGLSSAEME